MADPHIPATALTLSLASSSSRRTLRSLPGSQALMVCSLSSDKSVTSY